MTVGAKVTRGRPLAILALILIGWMAFRVAVWESPFAQTPFQFAGGQADSNIGGLAAKLTEAEDFQPAGQAADGHGGAAVASDIGPQLGTSALPPLAWPENVADELYQDPVTAAGHQLIYMAAMAHLPVPRVLAERDIVAPVNAKAPPSASRQDDRWSLEGWLFWRQGSSSALAAQGRVPSYGASQAAAILRYRLAPRNHHDPNAYLRLYRALVDRGENEAALGLSARPVTQLPIRTHAELRVTDRVREVELHPAAFVTTELPAVSLPLNLTAEAYGQAGYVAGDNATGFADGQLHILRDIDGFDLGDVDAGNVGVSNVSVGWAAWGGAQEGVRRLDIGPSLRVDLSLPQAPLRLSLDYRERVAGNASPQSGVALTISSRF